MFFLAVVVYIVLASLLYWRTSDDYKLRKKRKELGYEVPGLFSAFKFLCILCLGPINRKRWESKHKHYHTEDYGPPDSSTCCLCLGGCRQPFALAHTYIHTCTLTCTRTRTRIHAHAYTHAHARTHMHARTQNGWKFAHQRKRTRSGNGCREETASASRPLQRRPQRRCLSTSSRLNTTRR